MNVALEHINIASEELSHAGQMTAMQRCATDIQTQPAACSPVYTPPSPLSPPPPPDMAQGLLQVHGVQPRPHHEDLQGLQQAALLQHVSTHPPVGAGRLLWWGAAYYPGTACCHGSGVRIVTYIA